MKRLRHFLRPGSILLAAFLLAGELAAQSPGGGTTSAGTVEAGEGPAMLVADKVFITADRQLIAEGNVEAFQGGTRISAGKVTFDRETDTLTMEGPIRVDQGGNITVFASAAELDSGLQNGLLSGARMVMNQHLQLASLQMTRVEGRYTQLYKTAVTSCHVCENGKPPLWQIRARKVIHDQKEQQLYFEDAQFRVLDVPIFYMPRFRLPDPNLKRARGFLIPSVRTTSQLGTGLKLPYFIPLGDSRDLTLQPYVSSKTRTLDFRYRQALRSGKFEFDGAYTRDDLIPGEGRGYLFGIGSFDIIRDFNLSFDLQTASDAGYLSDYGLPDLDRLKSEVALSHIQRDSAFRASVIHYKSRRDSDDDETLPYLVTDADYEKRFFLPGIGGEARLWLDLHAHYRKSTEDILGRDVNRATADLSWRRHWIMGNGLRADWQLGFAADAFKTFQDSRYPDEVTRTTPRTALKLSYPMTRSSGSGVTHYLEPIVQIGWSNVSGGEVPNDESTFVEFDQGNLLALSRFPAPDRREDGPTLVYGLNWSRFAPAGWQASAAVGQVFRKKADPDFTVTSGLAGTSSDLLLAGQIKLQRGLAFTGRTLIDDRFSLSKAEFRGDWFNDRVNLSSTYLWLGADTVEGRNRAQSEFWFDGSYEVTRNWIASALVRYDISDARATRAGLGLIYQNECVTVNMNVRRRYTSSTSVEPSTDFGFTITLNGFAVDGGFEKHRRTCS